MTQRKPSRKKRTIHPKPEKYHPLNRAVKKRVASRRVKRRKAKKGEKEWKDILFIILGFLIAAAILIVLYYYQNNEKEK
jgi:hypothetical protein